MLLFEIFNKTLPWEWDRKQYTNTNMVAYFQVDGAEYNVEFDSIGENHWSCEFGRSVGDNAPVSTITGTGNQYAVFATVVDIVKEFMSQNDPDQLMFSAASKEPSRIRLYDRMLKMFPKDQYDVEVSDVKNETYYYVKKKGVQQRAA